MTDNHEVDPEMEGFLLAWDIVRGTLNLPYNEAWNKDNMKGALTASNWLWMSFRNKYPGVDVTEKIKDFNLRNKEGVGD